MKVKEYRSMLNENRQPYMTETGISYKIDGRRIFNNPEDIAHFVGEEIGLKTAADEYVYILCLDSKLHLTGLFQASHGSVNGSMFPMREIFQKALLLGAVHIVITHNHPSGDPTPSQEDINTTGRALEAGKILDITVLDHIIISSSGYISLKEYVK